MMYSASRLRSTCAKFYDNLKLIQEAGCTLDAPSFDPFITNPVTAPNPKCPPRLHQLYISYGADKRFGTQTATNSKGVSFPNAQCSKHLGREMGFGVAGELATIEITAKTMAMRMLKPATFRADNGILNCCEVIDVQTTRAQRVVWCANAAHRRVPHQM